jgi:DNA-binding NtrC family response regulator
VPALIAGPSGAGKRLAAAVIHAHSPRSSELLEVLACLLITDASDFERTGSGTLVLNEVTELTADLQTRLAAWLANASHDRVRVLATTSRDPREAVSSGVLREDLYYALSTLTIPLPPLCERSGDIPALSSFFVGMRGGVSSPPVLTPPVLSALQAYGWPGNVRELRHVLDYAVTMSGGGPVFLSHLPTHVAAAATTGDAPELAPGELEAVIARWLDAGLALPEAEQPDYELLLERIETVMLRHLLERHENRPTRLAAALRIHRATLRQKLRRVGLQRDDV